MITRSLLSKLLTYLAIILSIASILTITGCDKDETPEDQVRQFIQSGSDAVEKRDISDVKDLIAKNYSDTHGNNRQTVVRILTGYFLRNKNIHLLINIQNIHLPDNKHADVQLLAGMAGQSASDLASLFDIRANVYKFDLRLVKDDDDWQLVNARWSVANREDLFSQ